jgi:hypothetical protein
VLLKVSNVTLLNYFSFGPTAGKKLFLFHHEEIWGNVGIAPFILSVGIREDN